MKKTAILSFAAALLMAVPAAAIPGDKPKTADNPPETLTDREKWCDALYTMAEPVLSLMSEGRLQEKMLVETSSTWDGRNVRVTYMECFGRLMAGLAPWISLPDDDSQEGKMRKQLREWALSSYRTGVLQPLAMLAWRGWLPGDLSEGQVRAAMTAVIENMFGDSRNYNKKGFLTLGFNGSQPEISDYYTNNGSLYMASLAFLPLGLPADDPFWTSEAEDWT